MRHERDAVDPQAPSPESPSRVHFALQRHAASIPYPAHPLPSGGGSQYRVLGNAKHPGPPNHWAAAGFMNTLLRWKAEPEIGYGNETAIQPGVQA